jgi:GWxTD domain-containing protein
MTGYQERTVREVRDPDVLVGSFDVSELPSGSYFLRFAILDENNQALAEHSKKFFVLNPNVVRPIVAVNEDFETSLYSVMSPEEVADNLAHARVIATQTELREIRNLSTLETRRAYLARFWQSRDTDSEPSVNAARREFYERLRYAADRYDTPFEEVWETDRARVLLKYGYPSDVDPRPFDQQLVPHEIWAFDNIPGQGTSLFIFADREGLGRFDLIHSTVTGEISEPNWQQLLQL